MKLLELLVNERIKWHPEALCYTQDSDDHKIFGYLISNPDYLKDMSMWTHRDVVLGAAAEMPELADDWQTAIVTKEQYDNACKLVDDGYTLWFGGKCPVNKYAKVIVKGDFACSKGDAHQYNWENVKAYKVLRENAWSTDDMPKLKPEGSREPISFNCRCETEELPDVVNHPSHYTNGKVECIDALESATVGKTGIEAVCVANVIKYLWRYEDKNGLEDIKKAQWYLNKLIEVKK